MSRCQNQVAAHYAFPETAESVRGRRMTLTIPCTDDARYVVSFRGLGSGKARSGATSERFGLCENHSQLLMQIDQELVTDGWGRSQTEAPAEI